MDNQKIKNCNPLQNSIDSFRIVDEEMAKRIRRHIKDAEDYVREKELKNLISRPLTREEKAILRAQL